MWTKPGGQPNPSSNGEALTSPADVWPTAEQQLLLQAALWSGDDAVAAWSEWTSRVDLMEDHVDEGSFRLLPLVYRNLERLRLGGPLIARLKGIYRYSWAKNIALFNRSQSVLQNLHAAGINTIVLKGVALSLLYYRDRGTRPMSDIDILVPTRDAEKSLKCLTDQGWRKFDMREDGDLRYHWAATLVNGTDQQVDLHWHALHECVYAEADDDFWDGAVPLEMSGFTTRALNPADNLLHVISHGIHYNIVSPIRWATDAAVIIRSSPNELSWDRLLAQARKRKLVLRVGTGLGYLHDHLKISIPSEVLRSCRDRRPSIFEQTEFDLVRKPREEINDSIFGVWPLVIVEYRRITMGQRLWRRVLGFADYARYRLALARRRELVPVLLGRLPGKIRKVITRLNPKAVRVGQTTGKWSNSNWCEGK